jgi:hypothetical protein
VLLSETSKIALNPNELHKQLDDLVYRLNVITY